MFPAHQYFHRVCIPLFTTRSLRIRGDRALHRTERNGIESIFRLLGHSQTITCPDSCMTEAGDTSVLRTGRSLLYDKNPNRKNANAFTLLARMMCQYVLTKKFMEF